jgi:hypothetical protein
MEIIKTSWDNDMLGGDPMLAVQRRLSSCHQALSQWSWRKFGNAIEQLKRKTKQLVEL